MPVYVYRFEDGTEIEVRQDFDDEPLAYATHPERLHAMPVKRVPQAAMTTFKGSGWARK